MNSKMKNSIKYDSNRVTRSPSALTLFAVLLLALAPAPTAIAGYTTVMDDNTDLYQSGQAALGSPSWRVSEPFISLWLQSPVIRYTTSAGKAVHLDISFRQRGTAISNTNSFGSGPKWQCSWLSCVNYDLDYEPDIIPHWSVADPVTVIPPLGGSLSSVSDGHT